MPEPKSPPTASSKCWPNPRTASRRLNCPLGKLQPGAAADIVVTDYQPSTPLTTENAAAHFIFAMSARHVRHVMVAGRWLLKDRRASQIDEEAQRHAITQAATDLWKRMSEL